MMLAEKAFEAFRVGDVATFSKTITEADIVLFAGLSGDFYPLHVNAEYAKTTRFGARIAHGLLSSSLLSTVNAILLGVPGGIYVQQSLQFRRPVFIGDTLTARAEVVALIAEKRRFRAHTTVSNQHGKIVIEGEAVLQKDDVVPA
jgi:3-hydroxybutyryl-CoA dehydratase